jgi:hypothetical protein
MTRVELHVTLAIFSSSVVQLLEQFLKEKEEEEEEEAAAAPHQCSQQQSLKRALHVRTMQKKTGSRFNMINR